MTVQVLDRLRAALAEGGWAVLGKTDRANRASGGVSFRQNWHVPACRSLQPRWIAVVLVGLIAVSGCSYRGAYDMPLPGGADVGDHPYRVKIRFADVLDLVPNAGVRVNDVPVGRVERIGLAPNSWQAEVTVLVNSDVRLPANSVARLRQSSLLGEKFVELAKPAEPTRPVGRLTDGALIGIDRTGRNPEVEEVLGALSLLLNGGGVAQLHNITQELNAALDGREGDVRSLLSNVDTMVKQLDAQRGDITRALDSINRLSAKLDAQRGNIDVALRDLGPGLQVLNDQRAQLVTMLQSLDKLSGVATNVVNQTRADLVHNLNVLAPTLRQLAAAGSNLPKSLEVLLTFPFPDNAVDGISGSDYTNLYVNADLDFTNVLENLSRSRQSPLPVGTPSAPQERIDPTLPLPLSPRNLLSGPTSSGTPSPGDHSGGLLGGLLGGS